LWIETGGDDRRAAMKLYGYWRSSASYRARIALNLKGLPYEDVSVDLAHGETAAPGYRKLSPQAIVPTLEDQGLIIPQSLAICEYLEERYPNPPLLPHDPGARARVRAIALAVACEIHPLANRRVQSYLSERFKLGDSDLGEWSRHWIGLTFGAIEEMLVSGGTGRFCHGDAPSIADVFLVPQVYNANRVKLDLAPYPAIRRVNEECLKLKEFDTARPELQPDAPES
jgi:maleylacetoacetate isomerase